MADFTVAVRPLAEFCHRRGDIDYRFTPSPTGEEGIAGHREVYQRREPGYLPEHALEETVEAAGLSLQIRGRADGYHPALGYLEEIKTCRVDPEAIPANVEALHWAQLRLYGALLLRAEPSREQIRLRLTWYHVDEGREVSREQTADRQSLQDFLADTTRVYAAWLQQLRSWRQRRDRSIEDLAFPFAGFRPGQRELAEAAYKCIHQAGQLLIQAPTGIGKTAAVLYPALKALAGGHHDAIAFLTARTVGRRAAEATLASMERAGLLIARLSLTARESICFSPGKACHGEDCPYADGYYDRLPAARQAALDVASLDREALERLAREHQVCPYQLGMDMQPWVDITVADIHYVYSFFAGLGREAEAGNRRLSVLLDEAHNLPGRARDMFSAGLAKAALMQARRESDGSCRRALDACNRQLLALQKADWAEPDYHSQPGCPEALLNALQRLVSAVAEQRNREPLYLQTRPRLLDFYFAVLQFLRVAEVAGDEYLFELTRDEGAQGLRLRLQCLDPARLLAERQDALHAVVAFSATVTPAAWVLRELGFSEKSVYVDLASPFEAAQFPVYLDTGIDIRFRHRDRSLGELCRRIDGWLREHRGNTIVYFPSYRYMSQALERLEPLLADREVWIQSPGQSETDRSALLAALDARQSVVAFCILGGVFGEGVDLPGERLSHVVVVGVGLPQFDRRGESLRAYHESQGRRGFEYAYLYPGMQKVSQALGRVIRDASDRGTALLIDARYRDPAYRDLLPPHWRYLPLPVPGSDS